jgi:predicted ATPase
MIRRVKIGGYKSLADVEVRLKPLSVLFGPNSAGKSNFLDALQLLARVATARTLKEAFDPPYRGTPLESFTFGPEGVESSLAREYISLQIEVDVELSPVVIASVNRQVREMKRVKLTDEGALKGSEGNGTPKETGGELSFVREKYLRYRIEIEIRPKSGLLHVTDEYLAALNVKGEPNNKRRPFLERMNNRLHLRMEGQAHPTYYELYLDHSMLSLPLYPPHYPHLVAMRQELASWFFFYFEPRERMRAPNPVREVRHIGLMGEELASFLNTLRVLDEPQFKTVEKSLHLLIPSVTGINVGVNKLGEVELKLLEGTTPIPARVLSEGTLRVLGLLALGGAKEQPALIGFEEPENGIHPRRIRMIAELLKTRARTGATQLIVTTHSPLLPDMIPDESLYVCRKIDGRTRIEPFAPDLGTLSRPGDIATAMDEEESLPVSERILRGDFDA